MSIGKRCHGGVGSGGCAAAWRVTLMAAMVACSTGAAERVETAVRPVTEKVQGVEMVDPYRWLEGDEKGNVTPEVVAWTEAQNARTRSVLDAVPGRDVVEKRMRELMEVTTYWPPEVGGGQYFYKKREGRQDQAAVYVREGGADRVLIDPNKLDEKGLMTLDWFEPSQDGKVLAFGTSRAGDEISVLHLMDVSTGKWMKEEIGGKAEDVYWWPGGEGFLYRRLADAKDPYSWRICVHRVGEDAAKDAVLFEQYKEGPLATTWGPDANLSRDGRWMVLEYWTGTKSNDLWVVDFAQWRETRKFEMREVVKGVDARFKGLVEGDTLFVQTTQGAPNGRVLAVDLKVEDVAISRGNEIVAERKEAVIDEMSLGKGTVVLGYQRNATSEVVLCDLEGKNARELKLPGIGTASVTARADRTEAFVTFSSFNRPTTIYRADLASGEEEVWARPEVPIDSDSVDVEQVWYASKDKTRVSMFVVHKKGMKLDGENPVMLTGYGGFGISETPWFAGWSFAWVEGGGVLAVPNLRGGGEYGEAWHEAGMLGKKQNTFDDFIAAGEWLIEKKYTRPERLGIAGWSNGGLLTGACVTQRPELFGAAIVGVPLLDMVRYQKFLMARYWVPEYGSSEEASQFEYLRKYSPYHNVKEGMKYPAVLLTAGENDKRVHPMHARKMAAKLQAATASDPEKKPVLLWVEREAGHGAGKPLSLRVRDAVDQLVFLKWQLGKG